MIRVTALAALAVAATAVAPARQGNCNVPTPEPSVHVALGARPFTPIPTPDGCWILVTLSRESATDSGAVAVLRRSGGRVSVERKVPIPGNPGGAVLSRDGKTLVVASGSGVAFLDVARLTSGAGDPLIGLLDAREPVGFIYASVSPDDRLLFVAAERAAGIAVIDFAKARKPGVDTTAVIGIIPHGNAPVGLAFSGDGKYLFSTAQAQGRDWNWPIACKPEANRTAAPDHTHGVVITVDVAKAAVRPESSVVSRVAAGCNPVRLITSPDGARVYVSARGDDQLLVFDAKKLVSDTAHALLARVSVGTAPVGVAVIDGGKRIVLTNSNRFAGTAADSQPLAVVDAAKVSAGDVAVLGTIRAGAFPRELRVTADGKTLLVSNYNSRTLQFVDLARVTLEKK